MAISLVFISKVNGQTIDDAKYYYDRLTGGNPKVNQVMYYRSIYMANMEEARRMGADLTNIAQLKRNAKTPDELMRAYQQKTEEINHYIQQKQQELNREVTNEAVRVLGDLIIDGETDPVSLVTNGLSILQRKGQANAEKEKALAELTAQMHKQMDQLKAEIIESTRQDINNYFNSAAYAFTEADEQFYLDFSNYLNCYIRSMNRNYNYKNTLWLQNNCDKPIKPFNIPNKIQTEWEQLYLTAKRKYDLYKKYEFEDFLISARKYTDAAIVKNENYFEAYYFKAQIVDNSAEKYVSLLIASNLLPRDIKVKQEKDDAHVDFKTDFFYAIKTNDIPYLQTSIKYGLQKGIRNSNNEDPILYSVLVDNPDALQLFLNEEAEQSEAFKTRLENLLFLSAIKNAGGCCERLIKLGVNPDTRDRRDYTPLLMAFKYGANDAVEVLMRYTEDYDQLIASGTKHSLMDKIAPVLMKTAIDNGDVILAKKIHDVYKDVSYLKYHEGGNIIIHALIKSPAIFEMLLLPDQAHGRYDDENTLLHYAAYYSQSGAIKMLLDLGTNVNAKNSKGESPVLMSLYQNNKKTVEALLRAKPDLGIANNEGTYPIHLAAARPMEDYMVPLLSHQETIDKQDKDGFTPLHHAAKKGWYSTAKFLVKSGAEKYVKDKNDQIPYDVIEKSNDESNLKDLLRFIHTINGWVHDISPGFFTTSVPYSSYDTYGRIESSVYYSFNYYRPKDAIGIGTGLYNSKVIIDTDGESVTLPKWHPVMLFTEYKRLLRIKGFYSSINFQLGGFIINSNLADQVSEPKIVAISYGDNYIRMLDFKRTYFVGLEYDFRFFNRNDPGNEIDLGLVLSLTGTKVNFEDNYDSGISKSTQPAFGLKVSYLFH